MAVTVSIKTPLMSVERSGDSGFDEPTRIARVLRSVIEALEALNPRPNGLRLGDLVVLELGGHFGVTRPPPVVDREPEPEPAPEPVRPSFAMEPNLMETRRKEIALILKAGPARRCVLMDETGLTARQLHWAMDDPRFESNRHGWWQLKSRESVA